MKTSIITCLLLTHTFTGLPPVEARDLVLIENRESMAPIVVTENALNMTRLAAEDLADYLEKSGGVRPEILHGTPDPVPEHAIWVGYQPVLEELFPELDLTFEYPEEILIAANDRHLVIAGRDRWIPGHTNVEARHFEWGRRDIEGFQQEYGTANAVYTFLQDHLEVRWLWPGEEVVPERETIAVSTNLEYRYHPQFRQRHGIFWNRALHRFGSPGNSEGDWMRHQRVQLDSLHAHVGGHAFGDWWERFHETNPEFFALQPDGTRSGFPEPRYAKLCESNPAVWDQWLADVGKILEEDPNRVAFNAAANDSWASGHCICVNCRAWDHPEGKLRRFTWQGLSQDYVALSDRQVTFANQLARKLKAKYPEEDYMVTMLSYGLSRPAPVAAVPDDNVIVGSVHAFFQQPGAADRASPDGEAHDAQFKEWSEVASKIVWRPNVGTRYSRQGGPMDLQRIIDDFELVAEAGGIGLYIDTFWYYWSTQGPAYYLMAQLAWNPYADGEAILEDFYRRGFGPAAEPMEAYWTLTSDKRQEIWDHDLTWVEGFDDAFFELAGEHLDEAAKAASGKPAVANRVAFVATGLAFLKLVTENHVLMDRLEAAGGEDPEALGQAWENWDRLVALGEEQPGALPSAIVENPPGQLGAVYPGRYGER